MRFARSATLGLVAIGVAALMSAAPVARQRETRQRQTVVSVLGRDGAPMRDLTPADFVVREDGIAREVIRIDQASAPMQIALLVDTSADMVLTLRDVRLALHALSKTIWAKNPDSTISLMEFGERPHQLVAPTTNATTLNESIDRLFEHSGSGTYLLDALVETARSLQSRQAPRPVIVVFLRDASREFSSLRSRMVETAIKSSGAALWAFVLQDGGPDQSDEGIQRDVVLGDVTTRSGGMREVLLDRMRLEPLFVQVADRLLSQYVVTYGRPESLIPPTRLDVTVKRSNARVLAARWTGQ